MNADCWCWLLLLVAAAGCCCWMLLLVADAGCCCWLLLLVAAAGCCCWLLLLVAAAGCCCWTVFECFRDIGDLRLRQFCRRKSLWILSGVDDLRLRQFCRQKSLWIFSGADDFAAKTILQAEKSLNIFGLLTESLWIFPEYWWEECGRGFRLGEVG